VNGAIMRQPVPHRAMTHPADWSSLEGLALVVGRGGIGTALADALADRAPGLQLLHLGRGSDPPLDLCQDSHLDGLSERLRQAPPLRLVINTAGWLHGDGLGPEKRLQAVARPGLEHAFAINAFGPILLARAVEEALGHGQPAWFASLSARVGSIGDNRLGGWYAYRAAKAAQNQLLHTLALEWRRRRPAVTVTLLHPGTTATPLSEPFRGGVAPEKLFSPERAARQLMEVLSAQSVDRSGAFLAWDGSAIPW
jgi:NAD(P)-dependent dehydrogenase (short-subunit alcohol dehydrogenase family)